jgi:hypothetical protein
MKKIVFLIVSTLVMVSCSNEADVKLNVQQGEVYSSLASGQESEEELIRQSEERRKKIEEEEVKRKATQTSLSFDVDEHDFGVIPKDTPVTKTFIVTNTGENPLLITDAQASCGCTVPKRPEAPISPGETGELIVTFTSKSGQEGTRINKSITVSANIPGGQHILTIKGDVTP